MKFAQVSASTFKSMYIELFYNETKLSSGSAFFGRDQGNVFLFTNRHNVTGRDNNTGDTLSKSSGIPNILKVTVRKTRKNDQQDNVSNVTFVVEINLYKDVEMLQPTWVEHKNKRVDVVGIIFNQQGIDDDAIIYDLDNSWRKSQIQDRISVIGFPFGKSVFTSPIWVTGYIASEPDFDYENLPSFLIDCRARPGQSGSPVIYYIKVGQLEYDDGFLASAKKEQSHLLGIYSGRINKDSDLGIVWKVNILKEIISNGEIPDTIEYSNDKKDNK